MPFRVVYEIVRGSITPLDDPNWRYHRLPSLAGWWTGLFIAGQIISQIGNGLVLSAPTDADLWVGAGILLVGSILMTGAAITATALVAKVTEAQAAHAETLYESSFALLRRHRATTR